MTSAKLAHAVETGGDVGLHANAPLTPEGRRRLVERIDEGRPISHVAAAPVVIPEDVLSHIPGERRGQLSFDNNVPRVS